MITRSETILVENSIEEGTNDSWDDLKSYTETSCVRVTYFSDILTALNSRHEASLKKLSAL